jgi:uncharacterized membrane protein
MADITYDHVVRPFGRSRADAAIQARQAAIAVEQDRDDMRETHRRMLLGYIEHHKRQLAMYEDAYREAFPNG